MIWRSRGTSWKTQMTKVKFNFQYHKGIIKLELKFLGKTLLSMHLLYFVESAAALNEFLFFA